MSSATVTTESLPIVEIGDYVYVDYVGMYTDHPGGWVFDTSLRSVTNDASMIKSLYFVPKEDADFQPLNFTAGLSTSYLKAFVDGVVGMTVKQTKRIFLTVEEAYPLNPSFMTTYDLVEDIPIIQNMTQAEFVNTYRIPASEGMTVQHYFWEWNMTVLDLVGDKIIIQNMPYIGQNISSFGDPETDPRNGWVQQVIDIDTSGGFWGGKIILRNYVTAQDAYQKKGSDFNAKRFTLVSVDEDAGTYTIAYNVGPTATTPSYIGELAGRALMFEVTIVKILKAR